MFTFSCDFCGDSSWPGDPLVAVCIFKFYTAHSYSFFLFSSIDIMQTYENSVVLAIIDFILEL